MGSCEVSEWVVACPCPQPHTCSAASYLLRAFFFPLPLQAAGQGQGTGQARAWIRETRWTSGRWAQGGTNEYHSLSPVRLHSPSYLCTHYLHTATLTGGVEEEGAGRAGGSATLVRVVSLSSNVVSRLVVLLKKTERRTGRHRPPCPSCCPHLAFWDTFGTEESPDLGSCPS